MSLGREIKEAIGAFGAISQIDSVRRRTAAYEEMSRNKGGSTGLPPQAELDRRYKDRWGQLPPGARPPGIFDRISAAFRPNTNTNTPSGGMVYQMPMDPNTGALESPYDEGESAYGGDVEGAQNGGVVHGYDSGGTVEPQNLGPWAPRPSLDGAATAPYEGIPQFAPDVQTVAPDAPPVAPDTSAVRDRNATPFEGIPRNFPSGIEPAPGAVPARSASAVTPRGNPKRKALRDQTRTEAYDPVLDKDDPDNVIRLAINGAMEFATDTFHLKGDKVDAVGTVDPHTSNGRKAFLGGVGAAPESDIAALNQVAAQTAPDKKLLAADPNVRDSVVGLRRLVLVYEHFVQTGQTDKANKAAFEIVQYSAQKASEFGAQAKQAYEAGDMDTAKKLVARAYSQVPDGNHMVISPDGQTAIIRDETGKAINQYQITPQSLLQAAVGLSNKSMFWEILNNRANAVGKGNTKPLSELDKARIENLNARTEAIRRKGGGGGKAAPPPPPAAYPTSPIVQELHRVTGAPPVNPSSGGEGSQPAPPSTVEAVDQSPAQDTVVTPTGNKPPPDSVLRLKRPDSAPTAAPTVIPAKFDPEGDGYDVESAKSAGLSPDKAGNWPSRDPKSGLLLKGRGHETWAKTLEAENNNGYQVFKGKDGRYYSIMDNEAVPNKIVHDGKRLEIPLFVPPKYEVEHPGAKFEGTPFAGGNPYSKVLQDPEFRKSIAANTKSKTGQQELARIQNLEREFNNQVKAWEAGKRAFEKEHRDLFNKEQAANAAEAKRVYDRSLSTRELEELPEKINSYAEVMRNGKNKDGSVRRSIWNAPEEVVRPEELKSLATNLFTSNKNMSPEMAARMVAELTIPGTELKERQFMPRGEDFAGNVVVRLKGHDDAEEVHIRPGAYKKINAITERYRMHLLAEQNKPKEKSWGDIGAGAADLLKKAPDYLTNNVFNSKAPPQSGVLYDLGRANAYPYRKATDAALGVVDRLRKPVAIDNWQPIDNPLFVP